MTDDLCDQLAGDVETGFPVLVARHQDAVFGTALRCTGHWQDAEEIAQETFVRAYRSLCAWDAERIRALRPRAWLCTIAVNLMRNRARDGGRRPATSTLEGVADPRDPAEGPESRAARAAVARALGAALATLPPSHREAVVLRHVAGLGYAEIAAVVGAPVGTVKAHVHRGLRSLAEVLDGPALMEVS